MLVLTRRPGEVIYIEPKRESLGADPADWFTRPIEVWVLRVQGERVRVGVKAEAGLYIHRGERNAP